MAVGVLASAVVTPPCQSARLCAIGPEGLSDSRDMRNAAEWMVWMMVAFWGDEASSA